MLLVGKVSNAGRNFLGRICVQGRGGGKKFRYLKVDFYRRINSFGKILKILSKIYISGFLGLILYDNGLASYILLSDGVKLNDIIYSGKSANKLLLLNNMHLG
jgi:ribosomal protein L2